MSARLLRLATLTLSAACLLACATPAANLHRALSSDPVPDAKFPAGASPVVIPSAGSAMLGQFFLASGEAAHPTMLLLHGTPGNEQCQDLAQAARRAGWNVLTMHYRGSWGSTGVYSISNALADTGATIAWLRTPEIVARYRIDTGKLVIAGHSTGGYNAARYAAGDPALTGAFLLDAWNTTGLAPRDRKEQAQALRTGPQSLVLQSPESYVDDYWTHSPLLEFAPKLAAMPLLIVGADKANGPRNKILAEAIEKAGNKHVENINFPTGHAFDDHRVAIANVMLHWLDKLAARPR